jgi:tRNA-(ms[2]io[6]A)-hydroxylase
MKKRDLPLTYLTPKSWAQSALIEPLELLNDHAHLERKAATNALELMSRWPGHLPPEAWITTLISIAKDEVSHCAIVNKLLRKRGGAMTRSHKSSYANKLRSLVRLGQGNKELLDRLLISSLIEIRSCERFYLLADAAEDTVLAKLYRSLWASEHGHYTVYLDLARLVRPESEVKARWEFLLKEEGKIVEHEPVGCRIHSGVGV